MSAATRGESGQPQTEPEASKERRQVKPKSQAHTIVPGRVGPYRILRRLGVGTFGPIYLANDPIQERDIALRVFDPGALPWLTPAKATIAS